MHPVVPSQWTMVFEVWLPLPRLAGIAPVQALSAEIVVVFEGTNELGDQFTGAATSLSDSTVHACTFAARLPSLHGSMLCFVGR